jgi:kynurenine formamidase
MKKHKFLVSGLAVMLLLSGMVCLRVVEGSDAQAPSNHNATRADFEQYMKDLSNWGRWGKDDQMGAVNLITPAKRRQALATVKEGVSISMARTGDLVKSVDNPEPIVSKMVRVGVGQPTTGTGGTADTFFISYHGYMHTHMDSLCHFLYNGKMYNGYSEDEVTENGAAKNSVINFKNGFITRGILMDIPRLKGVDYLEPGTRIYPEDLDAWEKQAHLKVGPGDAVFIRTGRFARRDAKGPWPIKDGLAGLYITAAQWLHSRDVAILGGDAAEDVLPSGVEGISQPIHELVLVAMGMPIFDNCDLEQLSKEAARRRRWSFLLTASPAAVPGATGSVLNPIATF